MAADRTSTLIFSFRKGVGVGLTASVMAAEHECRWCRLTGVGSPAGSPTMTTAHMCLNLRGRSRRGTPDSYMQADTGRPGVQLGFTMSLFARQLCASPWCFASSIGLVLCGRSSFVSFFYIFAVGSGTASGHGRGHRCRAHQLFWVVFGITSLGCRIFRFYSYRCGAQGCRGRRH